MILKLIAVTGPLSVGTPQNIIQVRTSKHSYNFVSVEQEDKNKPKVFLPHKFAVSAYTS